MAYLIVRDRQLAEDIVEEAFLRVFDRIHQLNSRGLFGPWFLKIVINMARRCRSGVNVLISWEGRLPKA